MQYSVILNGEAVAGLVAAKKVLVDVGKPLVLEKLKEVVRVTDSEPVGASLHAAKRGREGVSDDNA
jgi:hypothetical protein